MTAPVEKSSMTPLVKTAGIIGTVQGFIWLLFSLASILLYENCFELDAPSIGDNIADTIHYGYLYKDNSISIDEIIIKPPQFIIFVYLYLLLSFTLLIVSSVILWSSYTGKGAQYYDKIIVSWSLIITISSLLDLILICLLANDYKKYKDNLETSAISTPQTAVVLASIGIVLTLAARGFVLWIVNVTFAIIFGKHCYAIYNKESSGNRSFIDGYSSGSKPWTGPSMYDEVTPSEHDNKGYKDDEDLPYLNQSNRYLDNRDRDPANNKEIPHANLKRPAGNNNYWNNRNQQRGGNNESSRPYMENDSVYVQPNPYGQPAPVRTAKIGRQGGQRSPPLNVAPPFIPDPDYSPPGSPKVKGVLRPKSNYMMY